ncbi:MAG TPA: hypothetical protein VHG08_05495 [Longimicrobium sp.]|nr:hypothetical protein [Longimicrobium sp.]
MKKLKLDVEAVEVESFPTQDEDGSRRGTVLGHSDTETQYQHTCWETCPNTCNQAHYTCARTCIWTE